MFPPKKPGAFSSKPPIKDEALSVADKMKAKAKAPKKTSPALMKAQAMALRSPSQPNVDDEPSS